MLHSYEMCRFQLENVFHIDWQKWFLDNLSSYRKITCDVGVPGPILPMSQRPLTFIVDTSSTALHPRANACLKLYSATIFIKRQYKIVGGGRNAMSNGDVINTDWHLQSNEFSKLFVVASINISYVSTWSTRVTHQKSAGQKTASHITHRYLKGQKIFC